MKQIIAAAVLVALALSTVGCKEKKRYSPSCQRAVTLSSPWDGYGLPTDGGRVCSSETARAELQYLSGDRPGWEKKFESALLASGFTKDKCSSQSCNYLRGAERAVVQVIETKRWVTVVVRK